MATFTFDQLAEPSLAESGLKEFLQNEYQMPSDEWWAGAGKAFEQLRLCLEISHSEEESNASSEGDEELDTDPEGLDPTAARAAALPILKLFRFGTHLLRVTPINEPLVCVAFGTIDQEVYNDIFWEVVAKVKEESELEIVVYDVYKGMFELNLSGYDFKILYRKCNDLVRSYPDVVKAPIAFLKDPKNGCLHVCDMVQTIKNDHDRMKKYDMEVLRLSYYYIRAWALTRGLTGIDGLARSILSPKDILVALCDNEQLKPEPTISDFIMHSLAVFDTKHCPGPSEIGAEPYPENMAKSWVHILEMLQNCPLREKMAYPYYILASVVFTCSGMRGGQWISMIEQRFQALPKSGVNKTDNYSFWPNRLVIDNSNWNTERPYEGLYAVGCFDPVAITNMLQKCADRIAKDKDTIQGESFLQIESRKASDFDSVLGNCSRKWPRKSMPNPLEKDDKTRSRSNVLELPIRSKVKKVHKDGKKSTKELAEPASNDEAHAKLRPASEVLNRLKYDPGLDIDHFVVGYIDRHTAKIQEKAAASWQRDTTHEEFIPEHRIQYFKKARGEIVWDRRSRLDKVFKESLEREEGSV